MNRPLIARLELVLTAVLFSTSGWCIKALDWTAWQIASGRSIVAAAALFLLLPSARRGWSRRTFIVGIVYAGSMTSFVLANKLTTAANTIFLQAAAPVYILFLSPWLLKESVKRADIVYMIAMLAGMALFFIEPDAARDSAPDPLLGNALAILSGVFWALTVIGLRWESRAADGKEKHSSIPAVVMGNLITMIFCGTAAFPFGEVSTTEVAVIVYLGVFQIGAAYFFLTRAIKHVPALESSLILNIEPTLNPIWVWIGIGERPTLLAVAGGIVILGATIAKSWWDVRLLRRPPRAAVSLRR